MLNALEAGIPFISACLVVLIAGWMAAKSHQPMVGISLCLQLSEHIHFLAANTFDSGQGLTM